MPQPLQPDQAKFLLNAVFLPGFEREHPTTCQVLAAVPTEKWDYRPDANSRSALDLAWHIAAAERRFLAAVADGKFDFSPLNRPDWVKTSADLSRWYAQEFQAVTARLKNLSGEQLCQVIDFRGIFQQPAVLFLQLALHHSVHHRGQLSTYLRPMGGKVPAIYGESYDSAEARKAAEAKSA